MRVVKKKCVAGKFPAVQFLRTIIRTSNAVLRQQTAVYGIVHGGKFYSVLLSIMVAMWVAIIFAVSELNLS